MANIVINETCNQKCPYCFASEFVNTQRNDMTFDNFVKATNFVLSDSEKHSGRIGIIGGEPLLHPQFDKYINYLIGREDVKKILVFTNGVLINEHIGVLLNKKVGLLVNVNSIDDVGVENYTKTRNAIDILVSKKKEFTLGLNIYDNIDYSFFINLAEELHVKRVRLSVVVPSWGKEKRGLNHFFCLKTTVVNIAKSLLVKDIIFRFDCNVPTPCIWDDEELNDLRVMGLCSSSRELIPLGHSFCHPVIDILPDLTAIRCFGMSDVSKVDISKFASISELWDFYVQKYDIPWSNNPIADKCHECKLFPTKCYGGCLANRPIQY